MLIPLNPDRCPARTPLRRPPSPAPVVTNASPCPPPRRNRRISPAPPTKDRRFRDCPCGHSSDSRRNRDYRQLPQEPSTVPAALGHPRAASEPISRPTGVSGGAHGLEAINRPATAPRFIRRGAARHSRAVWLGRPRERFCDGEARGTRSEARHHWQRPNAESRRLEITARRSRAQGVPCR